MVALFKNVPRNPHGIAIIGGDRFDTWKDKQRVLSISVELVTDEASEAQIEVFDPRALILNQYTSADGVPELEVKIYLGFGEDLGQPVYTGLLEKVERGDSKTNFIAYDKGYKMRRVQTPEFHKGDDLAIIKKLATRNGLKFEGPDKIDPPLEHHPSMIQDSKHDWDMTIERAREAGFVIYVRQDTLFCKNPAKLSAPILTMEYRKDFLMLYEFSMNYSLPENERGRAKIVEYRGRKRGGKRLTGRSREHPRGHKPVEHRHPLAEHTPKWVKRRAHAHKELNREPAWTVSIRSIPPLPKLRPDVRNTIELKGKDLGNLFIGPYICDRVKHQLTGSEFYTDYTLYRDKD